MSNTDKQKNHMNSMSYEYFLLRAYQFNKKLRRPSNQEFLNLIEAENGNRHSWLPKAEKQLADIKDRLSKAVSIFINKLKDGEIIERLEDLNYRISEVRSYRDIPSIVNEGLDLTKDFIK